VGDKSFSFGEYGIKQNR